MKKQLIFLLCAALFAACSNNASKEEVKETTSTESKDAKDESSTASSSLTSADDTQKRIDELKKLPALTNDQLKSFFPEEVMGMKRSQFSVNSAMGYAMGTAEYKKDDTTNYKVMIYDCAGEAGSAFYGMKYFTSWNMETEDDNGYQKTVTYNGSKALETFRKSGNEHTLSFVAGDRFWITLEGENTGLDNLKSFSNGLNLDKLKDIK